MENRDYTSIQKFIESIQPRCTTVRAWFRAAQVRRVWQNGVGEVALKVGGGPVGGVRWHTCRRCCLTGGGVIIVSCWFCLEARRPSGPSQTDERERPPGVFRLRLQNRCYCTRTKNSATKRVSRRATRCTRVRCPHERHLSNSTSTPSCMSITDTTSVVQAVRDAT